MMDNVNGYHISGAVRFDFVFFLLVVIQTCSRLKSPLTLTDLADVCEGISEVYTFNVSHHGFGMIHDPFTQRTLVDRFCSVSTTFAFLDNNSGVKKCP